MHGNSNRNYFAVVAVTNTAISCLNYNREFFIPNTNIDEAASLLERHMANLLAGIDDSAARSTLWRAVATRLAIK